jgi:hypothetical protein
VPVDVLPLTYDAELEPDLPGPVDAVVVLVCLADRGFQLLIVYVHQALFTCARCFAVTVTLEAGGADTDTGRAVTAPGRSLTLRS